MSAIERLIVPIAVAIAFGLATRYLPPSREVPLSDEEGSHSATLQLRVNAAILVLGLLFAFLTYEGLLWANKALAFRETNSIFMLLPDRWIWMFFPLFGGLTCAWELTLRLWMLMGGSVQAVRYETWSNKTAGFDATRCLRILAIAVTMPIAILTLMALPIHTAITDTGLSIGHFGSFTTANHSYGNVRKVTVSDGLRLRDGSIQRRSAIVLTFSDRTQWSSADGRAPEKAANESLLKYIQEKTHLPISHIAAIPF